MVLTSFECWASTDDCNTNTFEKPLSHNRRNVDFFSSKNVTLAAATPHISSNCYYGFSRVHNNDPATEAVPNMQDELHSAPENNDPNNNVQMDVSSTSTGVQIGNFPLHNGFVGRKRGGGEENYENTVPKRCRLASETNAKEMSMEVEFNDISSLSSPLLPSIQNSQFNPINESIICNFGNNRNLSMLSHMI